MVRHIVVAFTFWFGLTSFVNAQSIQKRYTTLSGFYDYQTNNTCQYIRVNPANGNMHAVFMVAEDSTAIEASRRTAYAFSSNGGLTWYNFANVRVPTRRSGYPSLDLLRGPHAGSVIIASHSTVTGTQSTIYVGSPEETGAFSELNPPPLLGYNDEPLWPDVAGIADGSVALVGLRAMSCQLKLTITSDYTSYLPWQGPTNDCTNRYVLEASPGGYIGLVYTRNGIRLFESHVVSLHWIDSLKVPVPIVIGSDTFDLGNSIDMVYFNEAPAIVFSMKQRNRPSTNDGAAIGFWSQATGVVKVVAHNSLPGIADTLNKPQRGHLTLGYPVIGVVGTDLYVGFQAFMRDTSGRGYNFSDVFLIRTTNGGSLWSTPLNLSNTQWLDERYPSISRWNPAQIPNLVWQEDAAPGGAAFPGEADTTRVKQVHCRLSYGLDVDEQSRKPLTFSLEQNYPNPFNPTTTIRFNIGGVVALSGASSSGVEGPGVHYARLAVFDLLGRDVATLVNEVKEPGTHSVQWDASGFASGVYLYQLRAGGFVQTKKLMIIR